LQLDNLQAVRFAVFTAKQPNYKIATVAACPRQMPNVTITAGNGNSFPTAQIHSAWTSVNDLKVGKK